NSVVPVVLLDKSRYIGSDTTWNTADRHIPREKRSQYYVKQSVPTKITCVHTFQGEAVAPCRNHSEFVRTANRKVLAHDFTTAPIVTAKWISESLHGLAKRILDNDLRLANLGFCAL